MKRKLKQGGLWEPGTVRLNNMLHIAHQKLLDLGVNIYEKDNVTIKYYHGPDVEDPEAGQLPAFTAIKVTWYEEEESSG